MIAQSPLDLIFDDVFFELDDFLPKRKVFLKLEGFNLGGSIKMKTAIGMIYKLKMQGILTDKSIVVESSSGNLGVALSIVCAHFGYQFICVTDPNALKMNLDLIKSYGGKVIIIKEKDKNGGYLNTRIDFIKRMKNENPFIVWTNQYANVANKDTHKTITLESIYDNFERLDYLFVGAGTTGTLMGCAEGIREKKKNTKIIAIDAEGSVTFGCQPNKRKVPGIGTSRKPELVNSKILDDILHVSDQMTVEMCHIFLKQYNMLVGGSTGSVLAGLKQYEKHIPNGTVCVAISPDFGDKYLDTIYNEEWLKTNFPEENHSNLFYKQAINF